MYGKDYDYAESRLSDSIVRIAKSGEPIHVQAVNPRTGGVDGVMLSTNTAVMVNVDDLNLEPVPLGWCNLKGGATYLARIPKRKDWKQGIRAQTCFSSTVAFRNIPRQDIAKCIKGEYPKFHDLFGKPWVRMMAWSRKWASDGIDLYYGNLGRVGTINDKGEPTLDHEHSFLKESLEKSLS